MVRRHLLRSEIHPYHVVNRTAGKESFPLPLEEVWEIFLEALLHCHREYALAIHGFVLMRNHFHLICHTPKANIDEAMHSFHLRTSKALCKGVLWEGRYKWSLIESNAHYYQVYRYIFQNPLRAKIVSCVEDYPFSTVVTHPPFPLHSLYSDVFWRE